MKIGTSATKGFQPVTLTIVFETQKELDTFGTVMNYSPIHDVICELNGTPKYSNNAPSIAGRLQEAGAEIHLRIRDVENFMVQNVRRH